MRARVCVSLWYEMCLLSKFKSENGLLCRSIDFFASSFFSALYIFIIVYFYASGSVSLVSVVSSCLHWFFLFFFAPHTIRSALLAQFLAAWTRVSAKHFFPVLYGITNRTRFLVRLSRSSVYKVDLVWSGKCVMWYVHVPFYQFFRIFFQQPFIRLGRKKRALVFRLWWATFLVFQATSAKFASPCIGKITSSFSLLLSLTLCLIFDAFRRFYSLTHENMIYSMCELVKQ